MIDRSLTLKRQWNSYNISYSQSWLLSIHEYAKGGDHCINYYNKKFNNIVPGYYYIIQPSGHPLRQSHY